MADIETIKDRIRKLLSLAGSNPNENEAAAAAARAQALCDQYNLDASKIGEGKGSGPAVESLEISAPKANREGWEMWLFDGLGRACECSTWISNHRWDDGRSSKTQFMAVGYPADVALLKFLYPYLHRAILELYKKALMLEKAYGYIYDAKGTYRFKRGFTLGAIRRITQRLIELRDARRAEDPGTRALVVVKGTEVKAWVDANLKLKPNTRKFSKDVSAAGFRAGQAAGDKVNLNRPLGDGQQQGRARIAS